MKNEFIQTVNLWTIGLQLRVKGSNIYYFLKKSLRKSYLFLTVFTENQV